HQSEKLSALGAGRSESRRRRTMAHKANANLKKGDYVVTSFGFPAIVQDNYRNRNTRLLEVWGICHEWGSEYADELRPVSQETFETLREQYRREWGRFP
ncbi:MAG: hypothetical protein ACE5JI_21320, partial [Acidobacteriota bacterium]